MRPQGKEGTAKKLHVCVAVTGWQPDLFTPAVSQEIAEELGFLSSDSSEEEVLTTRVVRRRVIIQVTAKFLGGDAASAKRERRQRRETLEPTVSCSTIFDWPPIFITWCLLFSL